MDYVIVPFSANALIAGFSILVALMIVILIAFNLLMAQLGVGRQ